MEGKMKHLKHLVVAIIISVVFLSTANAGMISDFVLAKDGGMISSVSTSDENIFCSIVTPQVITIDGDIKEVEKNIFDFLKKSKKMEVIVYSYDVKLLEEILLKQPNVEWEVRPLILQNESKPSEFSLIRIKKIKQ